ncbi:radical SAM protein [Nocardia donostiensis]|uniref:Radical SAM core domain-containing protein n=1 Tax=Nocardia donostiensis TaxID=1538463 RepID=A0A1W0B9M0_9NOCA|nr:radical SAM protein [Nocardia donostiensis]ONM49583.1 hypothetical protein B0T46_06990 [Nocardia donostiensis]OQS19204.1 hypothetical protein B0T44_15280 [Nocardia donostiensis]
MKPNRMLTAAPIYVSWNYTYACNFNCIHCYSRAGSYPRELDTEAYRRIVDQLVECRVLKVGLGGGEPLIRRDCLEMVRLMSEGRIDTNITTNGWFLNARTCSRLADAGLGTLYVSLDSANSTVHDIFRRKQGSYDRAADGISNAVAAGLTVKLSTVVTTVNANAIGAIVSFAEERGVAGIEFKRFRPTGNGQTAVGELTLRSQEEETLRQAIDQADKQSPIDIALFYDAEAEPGDGAEQGCPCGVRSLTLRPNGDVAPCAYGASVIGNLTTDNLGAIWRESPVLRSMRSGSGCKGLISGPSPSGTGTAPFPRRVLLAEPSISSVYGGTACSS